MYDRMLIPLDGSDHSALALAFGERLPCHAIRLLRVDPDFNVDTGFFSDAMPSWRTLRTEQLRDELARSAARYPVLRDRIEFAVRFGDPAEEIIAAATDADLIVTTTRGRGAMGRAIFCSTADRVARYGTTSTLLLRGGDCPLAAAAPNRIVVPLDGSVLAEAALPEARKLATALATPLLLVSVVDLDEIRAVVWFAAYAGRRGHMAGEVAERERTARERTATRYLAQQVVRVGGEGIAVTTEVRTDSPASCLMDLAQPDDLIVMTSHGRGDFDAGSSGALPSGWCAGQSVPS